LPAEIQNPSISSPAACRESFFMLAEVEGEFANPERAPADRFPSFASRSKPSLAMLRIRSDRGFAVTGLPRPDNRRRCGLKADDRVKKHASGRKNKRRIIGELQSEPPITRPIRAVLVRNKHSAVRRRYSAGATPKRLVNLRVKWLWSAKAASERHVRKVQARFA